MSPPELDVATIRRFCEQKTSPGATDLRIEADVHRLGVDIFECRPPWRAGEDATWIRTSVARLRWNATAGRWSLQWRRADERLHDYDGLPPCIELDRLLEELDCDPDGVFWG